MSAVPVRGCGVSYRAMGTHLKPTLEQGEAGWTAMLPQRVRIPPSARPTYQARSALSWLCNRVTKMGPAGSSFAMLYDALSRLLSFTPTCTLHSPTLIHTPSHAQAGTGRGKIYLCVHVCRVAGSPAVDADSHPQDPPPNPPSPGNLAIRCSGGDSQSREKVA